MHLPLARLALNQGARDGIVRAKIPRAPPITPAQREPFDGTQGLEPVERLRFPQYGGEIYGILKSHVTMPSPIFRHGLADRRGGRSAQEAKSRQLQSSLKRCSSVPFAIVTINGM